MLTWGNHAASVEQSARNLGVRPNDRWLASLPFYHAGGLAIVLRAAIDGTGVVLCDGFGGSAMAQTIDEHRVTLISLVGETLRRLIKAAPDDGPAVSLRAILLGGGPVDSTLRKRAVDGGWPILSTYGMTETASQVATQSPDDEPGAPPDSAPPLALTEIAIGRPDGSPCGAGEPGEITVRGPTVMQGYLDDPKATAAALRDGWLHTGDRGLLDEHGRVHVIGRIDDMIVSGGENIDPGEVVAALRSHPAIRDAAVVGIPDPRWGQRPAACVEPARNSRVDPAGLKQFLRRNLSGFKIPDHIMVVETIPRLPTGKLDRKAVRGLLLQRET